MMVSDDDDRDYGDHAVNFDRDDGRQVAALLAMKRASLIR